MPAADFGRAHARALAGLVALALLLRLPGALLWWFNADEAIYLQAATADAAQVGATIANNAHPPLFYWLLRALATLSESAFVLRLPALVCGVALVPAVACLARRWFGARAGLWAAAWVAVGTSSVLLSQVMRPYAALALALTIAVLGLVDWLDRGRARGLVVHALGLVAAVGLHYSAFLVAGACMAGTALLAARHRAPLRTWLALAAAWTAPAAAMVALYAGHIAPSLRGSALEAQAQEGWLARHYVSTPFTAAKQLLYSFELVLGWAGPALPLLLVLAGRLARRRGRDEAWLLPTLLLPTAVAASWLSLYPLGGSRHSYHLVPLLTALAAGSTPAIEALSDPRWRRAGRALMWTALASSLACTASLVLRNRPLVLPREHFVRRSDARDLDTALRGRIDARAVLLADFQAINLLMPLLGPAGGWFRSRAGGPLADIELGDRALWVLDTAPGEPIDVAWTIAWRPDDAGEAHLSEQVRALLDDPELAGRADSHGLWFVLSGAATEDLERVGVGSPQSPFSELAGGASLGALRLDPAHYLDWIAAGQASR
ncbi:MAG TPA: glycosyltransferase family 39 protein [Planctomycetota bacterium]|nr:glycosyltransferase family 39 protein [Planctomycetota bacterium]